VLSTMSHSYLLKSEFKPKPKPDCLPGSAHHWLLETAQSAANDGRIGTSDGHCVNCKATYTFYNSSIDYDARTYRHITLGSRTGSLMPQDRG